MKTRFVLLASLLLTTACLTGCTGSLGSPRDNRAMSNHDTCVSGCNHDQAVCMDEPSSSREALQGSGLLPTSGLECQRSLSSCLDRCRGL